jgi:hypothetical protein
VEAAVVDTSTNVYKAAVEHVADSEKWVEEVDTYKKVLVSKQLPMLEVP